MAFVAACAIENALQVRRCFPHLAADSESAIMPMIGRNPPFVGLGHCAPFWADTDRVNDQERDYQPSVGVIYGIVGVALIAIGATSLANANENQAFGTLGIVLIASGLYAAVAGAVARGIQLARK